MAADGSFGTSIMFRTDITTSRQQSIAFQGFCADLSPASPNHRCPDRGGSLKPELTSRGEE